MQCALCERLVSFTSGHHLIPRMRHNNRARRVHTTEELNSKVGFCRDCHRMVHALLSERQLEREFNTIELLRAQPDVARYLVWVRGRPEGVVSRTRKRG